MRPGAAEPSHAQPARAADAAPPSPAAVTAWERPRSLLLAAIWFGLVLGYIEAVTTALLYHFRLCLLDRMSPFIWTIPFTDAAVLSLIGLVLSLWARLRGKRVTPRLRAVAFFLFTFLSVATLISLADMVHVALHLWAVLLLCGGCGVFVARQARGHARGFHVWMARTAPVLAAGALICGLAVGIFLGTSEHSAIASIPPADPADQNLLFIVTDTLRAESMSLYGYPRDTTPNLARWASHGVVFEQAISAAPFTLTSHASMFTGKYPTELSAGWATPLDDATPTLAQTLRGRGYLTVGIAANFWNAGLQSGLQRGFAHYESHRLALGEAVDRSTLCHMLLAPPRPVMRAEEVNGRFLHFMNAHPRKPFFAFLNYNDCHSAYDPEFPFDHPEQRYPFPLKRKVAMWCLRSFDDQAVAKNLEERHDAQDAYDACIQGLDRNINQLLQTLQEKRLLKNTVVVIVGDHGEQFGEHGLVQHADSVYRPAIHVPLIILTPDCPAAGQRVSQMVTLRDLPATLLEVLHCPGGALPGDSFAAALGSQGASAPLPGGPKYSYIDRGTNYTKWHPNADGPVTGVFLDGLEFIHSQAQDELYDFNSDPGEQRNLVNSTAHGAILDRCRKLAAALPQHAKN